MTGVVATPNTFVIAEHENSTVTLKQSDQKTKRYSQVACNPVHVIPGRVRFRVPQLANNSTYTQHLIALLKSEANVMELRINTVAASIAITYHTHQCSDVKMQGHLVQLIQVAATHIEVGEVTTENEELPLTQPLFSEDNDWSDLMLPACATVLALLGGPLQLPIPRLIIASSVAIASLPVAQRAMESLFVQHRLNIDCLDFLAITLSSMQGNLLTPALVMTLHEIGDIIRDRTARSSHSQASDLLDSLAHFAWVEREGKKQQIPAAQVQPNETVIVYPGEQIPVDGTVLRGQALVDRQKLTGESMPVLQEPGQSVFASTLVRSGELYIKAERVGSETRAGASIQLVQQAPVHDTRMENYAANIADKAVLPALMLAGTMWLTTGEPARAAAILTLDFVTGIRVSMPTTFLAALTHATRHGILIRSGRALEQLAKVDTIVFDKTGTLTQGDVAVVAIETVIGRMPASRVLELSAAAEQRLTHPVAESVMHYAQEQGVAILPRGEWNYEVGLGVRAEIEEETVLVGSARFLRQEGVRIDCLYEPHRCTRQTCSREVRCRISASDSLLYVATDGEFQGVIQYADPLRTESRCVLQALQTEYGMETHLLTGDNPTKANAVAQELSIPCEYVHAEAFPEQKAIIIRQLHEAGKTVAFVGDGLNDSVALAYADVSISFANGSEVARETADVVLMNDNLNDLVEVIAIAKQTMHIIQQNTALVVVPNLVALGLASTVGLHPLVATVVHNGSAIAAGINGLRPLMHGHRAQETGQPN
jgi:Cu2+-exporting ATPase